jgi:hypothetical protein
MQGPEPPYELTLEERPGYLFATIKATKLEYFPAKDLLIEIAAEVRGLRQTRLMIYRDVPSVMPRGQLFFIAVKMAEAFKNVKVALVNPYADLNEDLDFAALTGNNRGGNFKLFADIETAEAWLLNVSGQNRER